MFGMGFTEILIILIIAILFLGPDKLPSAMVDIAKFFRSAKNAISSVKTSIEEEMDVSAMKQEAMAYKQELLKATESLDKVKDIKGTIGASLASMSDDILDATDSEVVVKKAEPESQEVTFKKKIKEDKTDV
jgi:sec-independent protein translocase protein TatB